MTPPRLLPLRLSRQLTRSAVSVQPRRYQSSSSTPMRILSGIQPTGIPQLGNYLGALRNWIDLQARPAPADTISHDGGSGTDIFYCIVDLHALTVPRPPAELQRGIRDMARVLLACGVDPRRSHLFVQSEVPEHSELAWILGCQTPMGWLNRMTQWKVAIDEARDHAVDTVEHPYANRYH
ncbi:tRNA synthetases class I-domain-containing protein [Syncephalis pseudoplumigaleata]|uniref:tRNA synthetases class I-domain-containing protein n=1 Tax=Syncephalis pseudoplumigaleata TaxID=1712513 RepID=A0A4P9YW96_9FUNG|nr:tRNA synthetases class I-domain-containing protein [Syncephalis pseudoplumigaleata]|eukprot:RKP23541.1 tRNA synthetases class I-domain-containing protein [Syncephalis pseudoplumigaleata]